MITCGTQIVSGSTGGGGASAPAGTGVVTVSSGAFVDPVPSAATTRTALGLGSLATASSVTASQISDSTSAGRAVLTAADASAQRTALGVVATPNATPSNIIAGATAGAALITDASGNAQAITGTSGYVLTSNGAGVAPTFQAASGGTWLALYGATALYMGGDSTTGFATADYITASAAAAVPAFGPGQSLVVCLYPLATPTGEELVAAHVSASRGWNLDVGFNSGARRRLGLNLRGLNGDATVALTGSDWTVSSAYVLAVVVKADKSIRYSVNGGAVQTIAALTGTYTAPTSADTYDLGSTRAFSPTFYPLSSALLGEVRTYSTELSDADLVAACANRTLGTIPDVATGTVSTRFLPSDFAGGVRIKAQTGVTWMLKGNASIRPV